MRKIVGVAKVVDSEQLKRLLKVVSTNKYSKRDTLVILFSFGLGLRSVEIAAIKLFQVFNLENQVIEELTLLRTKNQKSRNVYLSDVKIKKLLLEYLEERKTMAENKKQVFNLNQPLFLSQKGDHFTNRTLAGLLKRLYKSAGINATSHSGRRTFATNLINKGINIHSIKTLMGHENINQTQKYMEANPNLLMNITKEALY